MTDYILLDNKAASLILTVTEKPNFEKAWTSYLLCAKLLKVIISRYKVGGLAQLGEHLPYKQEVTGSSPVSSIIIYKRSLATLFCYLII